MSTLNIPQSVVESVTENTEEAAAPAVVNTEYRLTFRLNIPTVDDRANNTDSSILMVAALLITKGIRRVVKAHRMERCLDVQAIHDGNTLEMEDGESWLNRVARRSAGFPFSVDGYTMTPAAHVKKPTDSKTTKAIAGLISGMFR